MTLEIPSFLSPKGGAIDKKKDFLHYGVINDPIKGR